MQPERVSGFCRSFKVLRQRLKAIATRRDVDFLLRFMFLILPLCTRFCPHKKDNIAMYTQLITKFPFLLPFRQLSGGTLEGNFLVDGSRVTLLPRAETGLLVRHKDCRLSRRRFHFCQVLFGDICLNGLPRVREGPSNVTARECEAMQKNV